MEITEEMYLLAKKVIAEYEIEQFKKYTIVGRFKSYKECENEAKLFAEDNLKCCKPFLSESYKAGYKEGIEHYLAFKNNL